MDGSSPLPLSRCGAIERQCHTARTLAQLLGLPTLVDEEADAMLCEAMQRLRTDVHAADLDKSSSQARLVALGWAVRNDPSLLERQMEQHTEAERQHFWNSIHKSIKEKDFTPFAFSEADYDAYYQHEKSVRAQKAEPLKQRLAALEDERAEKMTAWLHQTSASLSKFDWGTLHSNNTMETRVDALCFEGPDSVWISAEMHHPAAPARLARDLVLMVDLSGSMVDVIELLKECLHDIVARTGSEDRVCVIGFSSEPHLLCDWCTMSSESQRSEMLTAIDAMQATGGTNLVPAFRMAESQLKNLPEFEGMSKVQHAPAVSSELKLMPCHRGRTAHETRAESPLPECLRQRVSALVLLSDGDPEEPPEAVFNSACQALNSSAIGKSTLVALALGEGSNPGLMALTAQCGGGPSLYIRGADQLPEQLGRMWGYLSTLATPRDLCLVLKPLGGGEILEVERPLGGSVKLERPWSTEQFVVMSCGSAVAGTKQRLAAMLRLPKWANRTCLQPDALQKPLLQMTWLWREGVQGSVQMSTSQLRVLQIPSLFIEAQLGLPIRVVIDADWETVNSLDRSVFLGALANAVGVPPEKLVLDRLTQGSIIADIRIIDASPAELLTIQRACKQNNQDGANPCNTMIEFGYPVKLIVTPGGNVFPRVLQWRLARALEKAAQGGSTDLQRQRLQVQALSDVEALARGELARQLDPDPAGIAAAVAADAAAAKSQLWAHVMEGTYPPPATRHAFYQQAHGHCQQLCPELCPTAAAVGVYESEALRLSASSFVASACHRDKIPAAPVLELAVLSDRPVAEGTVSLRLQAQGEGAMAIVAFRVEVAGVFEAPSDACAASFSEAASPQSAGVAQTLVEDWSVAPGEALSGVILTLTDLPTERPLVIRAAASNGQALGPWSLPLSCSAHLAPAPVVFEGMPLAETLASPEVSADNATPVALQEQAPPRSPMKRQSLSKSRRSLPSSGSLAGGRTRRRQSSAAATSLEIKIVQAAVQAPDSAALSWIVVGPGSQLACNRWSVSFTPMQQGEAVALGGEVHECGVQVSGLVPSQAYRFCIKAVADPPPTAAKASFGEGLCIQGNSIARGRVPQAAEGVLLVPPYPDASLESFMQDATLEPFTEGVFVSSVARGLQK